MWKKWDGTRVLDYPPPRSQQVIFETDPATLARRQKQIDYGRNTSEYSNYLKMVPKESRTPAQPKTPDRTKKVSRRAWDGEIRMWRLLLHAYDDPKRQKGQEKVVDQVGQEQPAAAPQPSYQLSPYLVQQPEQPRQPYSFRGYNFARVSFSNIQL